MACAVIWWGAATACSFGTEAWSAAAFLGAIVLGLIGFGVYCMAAEGAERKRHAGKAHA